MPGENLTRNEAIERRGIVTTHSYQIALDLTGSESIFRSITTITFDATEGSSTFLDAITHTVHSITLNGENVPVSAADGTRIALNDLSTHNVVVVDADMMYTNTGEGLHRFVDPVDDKVYLYSQFEVPDSRRVFAVFEQPDLKATFQFTVTAPAEWSVISNSPSPAPVRHGDVAVHEFAATPRISSYITALIAGPYVSVHSELTSVDGRSIPLGIYVRESLAEHLDADYIFDITRKGFDYFENAFGVPYPFEKYDQLFVPEFNAGAMENAGAVTFTEVYVFRSKVTDAIRERRVVTILHELAHMWFGDLVTMKWWNDLWLNESFAEWASTIATAEATEWTEAWTTFQAMEKSWAYRQDQLPSTHPIMASITDLEDVQVNFDGITYAKGGSVLKQLFAWVGREAFFAGVSAYFRKHAWGNTELADLMVELEAASGRDLSTWTTQWLETSGVNTLRPDMTCDADGIITSFAVLQSAHPDYPTIRPHRLAIGIYRRDQGSVVRVHRVELDVEGERTEVPELVGLHRGDLILINDDDLAYAKIRLDEVSLRTAIAELSTIADPLARSLVWGSAWDATRDAEMSARDYITLVIDNIAPETESTTIRTLLAQLSTTVRMYADPDQRPALLESTADALWSLASTADAASDAQFQFVRAFAHMACTPLHGSLLRELRDGTKTLPGLTIDTDLSWDLLEGMVLAGVADETEIAAAHAADTTANGNQTAARVRATMPTAAAKRAIFDELTHTDDAPNAIVNHTALGFGHVNEPQILADIVDDYFTMLTTIWDTRTYQIASYLIQGLYPAALANQQLVDASTAWLHNNAEAPAALRRMIIENVAGVQRALAAQQHDRKASS
ncbi:MAG: aminopeptidase N [Microbacteriaceae bacterium]